MPRHERGRPKRRSGRFPYSEVTSCKMKSDKQVAKWLKNPYSDSAEYKMWGNGVALPCVWFVLCGIVWYAQSGGDNAPI